MSPNDLPPHIPLNTLLNSAMLIPGYCTALSKTKTFTTEKP